ncbi:uncharacterized protein BJ212DRAFT_1479089 [Suillus subaureus]|uniref:Uncharacterized protein n=1 Tax=Suillus subaureus TaxID=48587 RepID=A0A9P7EDV1_9AGAM|nr:uncharacterized protein BJ212DRAFT_1479089 [Suillus subaureus]KAG1818963.1 hypothetical protein BJ212DRAFT_1479089 [Suillus subaureus]
MDTHIYQMFSDELPTTIPNTSRRHAVMGLASHHHEAESHHHHHEAGSFLRRVHRAIMALGLLEGCAVAFVLITSTVQASSSEKENSGDVKELLPDGSVLQVYCHHEAESHHHHHEAGSFLRHVHHVIMALGLWEGHAVAFVLSPSCSSQMPNCQDDNINFKIITLHSHSVLTLVPQDPLQSLPQPQWDLRVHLPSHILIHLCECTSSSLCPPAFSLLPATHVGVH